MDFEEQTCDGIINLLFCAFLNLIFVIYFRGLNCIFNYVVYVRLNNLASVNF